MSKLELKSEVSKVVKLALKEDDALKDVTSDLTIPKDKNLKFVIQTRQDMVFCGQDIITETFNILKSSKKFSDAKLDFKILVKDGDKVLKNKNLVKGSGDAKLIFAAERVILNLLQILSGVSTTTYDFVKTLKDENIKILDTRKTLPNYRYLQKYAVKIGGGNNHRFSLSDMILIKDNHIAAAGGVKNAIMAAKKNKNKIMIEIECDNVSQVKEAITAKPDIIMLDNMSVFNIRRAIKVINKKCKIEVSGGINIKTIKKYRGLDIDFISVGAITHSPNSIDIGLDIV
ncbi:MAG: carboxylating nicotinate-nucleotide diphosphorylase [Rickettsiales bacterium]|nr:carboxylating nicotinate-nucleotide diphosphorylase [Rickettsiales bacterium]